MEGRCIYKDRCRNSHDPTEEEERLWKDNKMHSARNLKQAESKSQTKPSQSFTNDTKDGEHNDKNRKDGAKEDVECLYKEFNAMKEKMDFLGDRIVKISRYNGKTTAAHQGRRGGDRK